VPREQIADARSITSLAAFGAPVTSNDAKSVVRFMQEFERVNSGSIPQGALATQLGWQGDGNGFLLGTRLISAGEKGTMVEFRGADSGDDQMVKGFRVSGKKEVWKTLAKDLSRWPVPMFCLYAGLSAPLLKVLDVSNFVVDLSGETSTGKSTCVRFAMSAWGNCSGGESSLFHSFDSTNAWRERAPTTCADLPFCLDETKHAKHPDDVKQFVYMINQGRSKGRATRQGTQESKAIRNVMFLTGEQPAISFTQDGGTCVRTLTIRQSPFGGRSQKSGELVDRIQAVTQNNYGHMGRAWIEHIVHNADKWRDWRASFVDQLDALWVEAGDNAYARRLSSYLALIRFTAVEFHEAFQLPWKHCDPVEPLYAELCSEAQQADRAAAALCVAVEYAIQHPHEFTTSRSSKEPPFSGWTGVMQWLGGQVPTDGGRTLDARPWDFIAFFEPKLDKILSDARFNSAEAKQAWHDRKWLKVSEEKNKKRRQYRVKINGTAVWTVAITYDAYEAACR
jgi:hypothetical protein